MRLTISVALCTFNGSRFLPAQLESITQQNRLPDELIICDDGSHDSSEKICRHFARNAPFRVLVVRNEQNLGYAKNFAKAISLCRGKVIALADQDDLWYRQKLERIQTALESSAAVAAFSDADLIDENSKPTGDRLWNSFLFSSAEQLQFTRGHTLQVLAKHPVVTGATLAFNRECIPFLLPIPPDQFHDAWIAFLLAARGRITPIREPLMQYRQHQAQQIGPGKPGVWSRLAQSQRTGRQFYEAECNRFRQLADRIRKYPADFPFAALALHEIENKIQHREHRADLPESTLVRVPKVFREIVNGRYWRYSEGWQSIAKDLAGLSAHQQSET